TGHRGMSNESERPRSELVHLVGGTLPDRVLAAENTLLFVLDGANGFVYFDRDLPAVYDPGEPLATGAEFRPELLMPSNHVARAIGAAQQGGTPEPFLVVARGSDNRSRVWQFEVF